MGLNFSYEFFPPANALGERRFWRTVGCLETMNPSFFSITYGALGSAQDNSIGTIKNLVAESSVPVAAHLTFEGSTRQEIDQVATRLKALGVDKIVALRGDDRASAVNAAARGKCYHTVSEFIAGLLEIHPFDISVACYPEVHPRARSASDDIQQLKDKIDAGANRAITQFFFDLDALDRFQDKVTAAGIDAPVVPGVLPIRDFAKMTGFAKRCGTVVPSALYDLFEPARNNPQLAASLAKSHTEALIDQLQQRGYQQFHIYTLNQPVELACGRALDNMPVAQTVNA